MTDNPVKAEDVSVGSSGFRALLDDWLLFFPMTVGLADL